MPDHSRENIAMAVTLMQESLEKFTCAEAARRRGSDAAYDVLIGIGFALREAALDLVYEDDHREPGL